jgi:hypothetical protein
LPPRSKSVSFSFLEGKGSPFRWYGIPGNFIENVCKVLISYITLTI